MSRDYGIKILQYGLNVMAPLILPNLCFTVIFLRERSSFHNRIFVVHTQQLCWYLELIYAFKAEFYDQ